MSIVRMILHLRSAFLLAATLSSCTVYKDVKDIVHTVKEKEQAGPQTQKQAEPTVEGPLLDNKVAALRVQDALRKAGREFEQVQVTGTKHGVIMTGTVKSTADRARAEEIAKSVHREMKLTNQLQVR
jgi:osmotically-inducible protein OsmY